MTSDKVASQRKRLLVLTSTFPRWPGDSEPPFVFELCRRLSAEFDVRVLTPHIPGSTTTDLIDGVRIRRYRYFFQPWEGLTGGSGILAKTRSNRWHLLLVPFLLCGLALAIRRECKDWKPDVVHAHWLVPQGMVATLALPRSIPLVCTSHGGDVHALKGRLWDGIRNFIVRRSAATIAVSKALSNTIASATDANKIVRTIPMGIDTKSRFSPGEGIARKHNELLFVGRLVEGKGLHVLLNALPQLVMAVPDIMLRVVGSGQEEKRLKVLSASLGLDWHVVFEGAMQNDALPSIYRRATMLIAPYTGEEGLGLVTAEALACGCPVIAADLAAIQDIVMDGTSGLLFRKGDKDHMAQQILHLLANPEAREQMAKNGRVHVIDNFDWAVITMQYHELLMSQTAKPSE